MTDKEKQELKLLAMVINEPGFKVFEDGLQERHREHNTLQRITANNFENGKLVGMTEGLFIVLEAIKLLRSKISEMKEEQ